MSQQLMTVELLKEALPKQLKGNATQELADKINGIVADPEMAQEIRNNFLSFNKVLMEGQFKTEDYLNAVSYCTFKLMGYSNKDAYAKAFPDRYTRLVANGASDKEISAYVAGYHKNKLVNIILEQAAVPIWLLNQDVYQKAINTQLMLMTDPDVSPKVRSDAANSIMTHLKAPEIKKVEIDMSVKNQGGIGELAETMVRLAEQQRELILGGAGAQVVSRIPVVQVAARDDDDAIDAQFTPVADPVQEKPDPATAMTQLLAQTAAAPTRAPEPEPEEAPAPVPRDSKLSLFANPPPAPAAVTTQPSFELKSPGANWAECCGTTLEDCLCGENAKHIYLPTADMRGPASLKPTVSLFAFGKDD